MIDLDRHWMSLHRLRFDRAIEAGSSLFDRRSFTRARLVASTGTWDGSALP